MYGVLAVMASGDAYGIFRTLTDLIKTDEDLVRLFTVALTLGSVAVAHEVGRLTRSRYEARGGYPAWIALLAASWLSLGGGIAWLRITRPLGEFNQVAGRESLQFGLLLLGLYLLTGTLAMSTAYRYGSPRAAELRSLLADRKQAVQDANDYRFERERAEGMAQHVATERQRRSDDQPNGEQYEAVGDFVKSAARYQQAGYVGVPQATDDLIPPPGPPFGQNPSR